MPSPTEDRLVVTRLPSPTTETEVPVSCEWALAVVAPITVRLH